MRVFYKTIHFYWKRKSCGNNAIGGGGIYSQLGTVTVTNSTLSGNRAGEGGGIYTGNSTLTLTNSTLSGNNVDGSGGGIFGVNGTVAVTNSTLSGNSADLYGGGIFALDATLTLTNSTLSGNRTDRAGGGIYARSGTLTITNSTLSGNRADRVGGGIWIFADGGGILTNSTLSGNSASGGGGIYNVYDEVGIGDISLKNTLLAANPPQNCAGAIRNDGNNLEDGTSCGWGSNNGSISGTDPLLGALGDYGGPTQTLPLLTGSPAIDAGSNAAAAAAGLDWDQRGPGYPRIVNGTVDIGAFEYSGPIPIPTLSEWAMLLLSLLLIGLVWQQRRWFE
jgi:parallel beta-helix repeat protein